DGGELAPGAEGRHALGDRPPHPTRPGEVGARPGVVDPAGLCRGDAALQAPYRLGDVELGAGELVDRPVGRLLLAAWRRPGAVQQPRGLGVEPRRRLLRCGARAVEAGGDRLLLAGHRRELLEPPLVGLVEVHRRPEEVARPQLVAVPADGVTL